MTKIKTKYVFVILVYRNADDLAECLESIKEKVPDSRVVIVNAFYDEESSVGIRKIAEAGGCDFIEEPNKGYSYGNNAGIAYAVEKYDFDYVIVSNPDIVIEKFEALPDKLKNCIVAPYIVTKTGKRQNPILAKDCRLAEKLLYYGFKHENKFVLYAGFALNKFIRELFVKLNRNRDGAKIHAAHGSFVIIGRDAADAIGFPLYDDNMFLFEEEFLLAHRAHAAGVKTVFMPSVNIFHKEDGSMKLGDIKINTEESKSFIYYYETYRR